MNPIGSSLDLGGNYISFSMVIITQITIMLIIMLMTMQMTMLMITFMSITYHFMSVSELSIEKDKGKEWGKKRHFN